VVGSVASLAANVAVAEPTAAGRVIAAWPSFALIGAYELLMRQVRLTAASAGSAHLLKYSQSLRNLARIRSIRQSRRGKPDVGRPLYGGTIAQTA